MPSHAMTFITKSVNSRQKAVQATILGVAREALQFGLYECDQGVSTLYETGVS